MPPHRSNRPAFAQNHRRDALADHALRVAIGQDRVVGMVVHVDEAGGNGEARGIDRALGGGSRKRTQGDDPVAADADIAQERGIAGAVDQAPAANQQIEILRQGR